MVEIMLLSSAVAIAFGGPTVAVAGRIGIGSTAVIIMFTAIVSIVSVTFTSAVASDRIAVYHSTLPF
jgi:hypothetical protein